MSSTILNGKVARDELQKKLIADIALHKTKPTLCIISIGNDERSRAYIQQKKKFGEQIGAQVVERTFDENVSFETLSSAIDILNTDSGIHGIIIQMPLPAHLVAKDLCSLIHSLKDVDGLSPVNIGLLAQGDPLFVPATAKGIVSLLDFYSVQIAGRHTLIINRSLLVGRPLIQLFLDRDATVTVAHSKTENLESLTRMADIIVVAVGKPGFITADMIKPGTVIVDVGISRIDEGGVARIVGDVDTEGVMQSASAVTPVPGGVGPMTVLSLFQNLLLATELSKKV
jgi:methylenetetrahydrofolate dehydrogenase (NADP+) / methenyltetrahydrofolate cyclohydrolase